MKPEPGKRPALNQSDYRRYPDTRLVWVSETGHESHAGPQTNPDRYKHLPHA